MSELNEQRNIGGLQNGPPLKFHCRALTFRQAEWNAGFTASRKRRRGRRAITFSKTFLFTINSRICAGNERGDKKGVEYTRATEVKRTGTSYWQHDDSVAHALHAAFIAFSLVGGEAWKKLFFCALLVSITTECKQSQTVMQNGTVVLRGGIQPLAARATAEKVASCQADKPSAGSACPFTKGHTLSASWMLWSSALRFHNYPHAARITDHNALYICEAGELPKCIVRTQRCRRFSAFNGDDQYYRMIMVYDGFLLERDIRRWMLVSYVPDNNISWFSRTYTWGI